MPTQAPSKTYYDAHRRPSLAKRAESVVDRVLAMRLRRTVTVGDLRDLIKAELKDAVAAATGRLRRRIAELEAELEKAKGGK